MMRSGFASFSFSSFITYIFPPVFINPTILLSISLLVLCCLLVAFRDTYYLRLEEFKDILGSIPTHLYSMYFISQTITLLLYFYNFTSMLIIQNLRLT